MQRATRTNVLFTAVTALCLLLVTWWVYFQIRETNRLERLGRLIPARHMTEALEILDADVGADLQETASRRRTMIISESLTLGLCLLCGIVLLYGTVLRERRLREQQNRFLTGATHHLKTPLATLRLGVESLIQGSMPETKKDRYLHGMLLDLDHLEHDISTLLAAGGLKAQTKLQKLHMEPGDLEDDVRAAVESMRNLSDAAGVDLDVREMQPAPVLRDRESLHLILHNLLDNAVKYSGRGNQVEVSLQRNGTQAELHIQDSGSGIAADDLPHVFDRFYRGQNDSHLGGSGIGLYLVRELMKSHGGDVTVSSEGQGRGSCFTLQFPLAKPRETA